VTGASEDESSVDAAGGQCPLRKNGNRAIRSAWGVVKRAMHLEDLARGAHRQIAERDVGARSRSVVGRSQSHASLVDDLLRSS